MRQPTYSGQFKRDVKQAQKRGKDMSKLKVLLSLLIEGEQLPATCLDHPLKGIWGARLLIAMPTLSQTGC